jgi:hypothetical protein
MDDTNGSSGEVLKSSSNGSAEASSNKRLHYEVFPES